MLYGPRGAAMETGEAVSKRNFDFNRRYRRAEPAQAVLLPAASPAQDLVATAAAIGMVAAGAALFEAALIPGLVIGGAAVLAPRCLPTLRKQLRLFSTTVRPPVQPAAAPDRPKAEGTVALPAGLHMRQAFAKTITFRVIVTTLDFGTNYLVISELGMAAGLSVIALVGGPVFYFVHETAWNYLGRSVEPKASAQGEAEVPVRLPLPQDAGGQPVRWRGLTISRALAKTITFRTFATTVDFATNFVVVGDVATAATLSALGFVVGPFVYFGHEKAWEYYGSRGPQPRTEQRDRRSAAGAL